LAPTVPAHRADATSDIFEGIFGACKTVGSRLDGPNAKGGPHLL